MAKFERQMRVRSSALASYLDEGIRGSGMSVELVDTASHKIGNTSVFLYVYDKYYMRNSSRAALSVQIIGNEDGSYVTAIGAGGGNGSFFSFSYGAEENFVSVVERLLDEYNERHTK